MKRGLFVAYGLAGYIVFSAVFLIYLGWLAGLAPHVIEGAEAIDGGPAGKPALSMLINLCLIAIFAVPHSVMARPGFKRWWTRIVPQPIERATYVWYTNLSLAALIWFWQPLPLVIWHVDGTVPTALLWAGFVIGAVFGIGGGSVSIDYWELLGVRQVWRHFRRLPMPAQPFSVRMAYRVVRHPIALGHLLVLWCTPHMTMGHLLLAIVLSAYVFIATYAYEERDLEDAFGGDYRAYRRRVPGIIPRPRFGGRHD